MAHELDSRCSVYSQDISAKSTRLLRINMILNGYTNSIQNIKQGDTLLNPYYMGKKYDYIVSNPPFKTDFSFTRNEIEERWSTCSRFIDGVPEIPKKKRKLCQYIYVLYNMFYGH